MLARHKRKANIGAILGFLAIVIALYITRSGEADGSRPVFPGAYLVAAGNVLFLWGCWCYAKSKGHPGALGLVVPVGFAILGTGWFYLREQWVLLACVGGAVSLLGLIILAFLPDKHPWGT